MEFKELSIEEMSRGYVEERPAGVCRCIFCGASFEEGVVYPSRGRSVDARRAASEHVSDRHGGAFYGLLSLGKSVHGLSETQQSVLDGMYMEKDNRELGEDLGISAATVRTHKFNIQRMKRESKILLAILEQIENEEAVELRKHIEEGRVPEDRTAPKPDGEFAGNSLHPFFTQFNLK